MSVNFRKSEALSLGVELELQILNRETLRLSSQSVQLLGLLRNRKHIKSEMYQCMIEVTTDICRNASDVGPQLEEQIRAINTLGADLNLALAASGLHPFGTHKDCKLYPDARYARLVREQRWVADRLLIFGLHIHVGMRSTIHAVNTINGLSHYLPLLLALSGSSPFFRGDDTRLSSCRTTFFESIPTGGHGPQFSDWLQFEKLCSALKKAGTIESTRDLWWDVRPSPDLGTVEIRICDAPSTISEVVALTALVHLICERIDRNLGLGEVQASPFWLLRENKWRAARDGIHATLLVDERGKTSSVREILNQLRDECSTEIRAHGYTEQMNLLKTISILGSSSDRQRHVFDSTQGDFYAVLNHLVRELSLDRPIWSAGSNTGKIA